MEKLLGLDKRYQLLLLSFAVIILFSGGFLLGHGLKASLAGNDDGVKEFEKILIDEDESGLIVVNVKGAVKNPGIYEFEPNSRVNDAILKAELLPEAEIEALNLAQFLKDEQEIIVPFKGETEEKVIENDGKISLNKGTAAELETIPGVGPVMAGNIISYRKNNNGFKSFEDLLNVSGIGEKTLEKMMPYLKL